MAEGAETLSAEGLGLDLPESASGNVSDAWRARRRTAQVVFQGALAVTVAFTAVWLFFVVTGKDGGPIFNGYRVTREGVWRVLVGFTIINILWGWLWWGIKVALLRFFVGFTKEEVRTVSTSRMSTPFDLAGLLQRHSERRIRIADMIGRRGRFLTIQLLGYWYIYSSVVHNPKPSFLVSGLQENLFDAIALSWMVLAIYWSDGFLGRMAFGAQSRIMDGSLARANCLLITTLWSLFKFFMVPLGLQIAGIFPPATYATLWAFIWISYVTSDGLSEVVGSLFGKQKLRVWGIGEINRKSIAGTWACFLGSLALCLALVYANGLPLPWVGLALVVSASNTLFELFSPRGTDDFTMASANALLCWGFGLLVYS
jgi:hypothetical protein